MHTPHTETFSLTEKGLSKMKACKENILSEIVCVFPQNKIETFSVGKKINITCLNKWGLFFLSLSFFFFFSFSKEKNKDLSVGKINPFTDGLAVSLSAQADAPLFPAPFPGLPAELVPQRMLPAPSHHAQPRQAAHRPPFSPPL